MAVDRRFAGGDGTGGLASCNKPLTAKFAGTQSGRRTGHRVVLGLAWAAGYLQRPVAEGRPYRLQVAPPPGTRFVLGGNGGVAVSPDEHMLAFIAASDRSRLWIRPLDAVQAREVPGTDGASYPFWSPDNRSVGFLPAAN